jgi:2-succinyl-5-enolpyruvyl-6-hydroxy-3-cyclohexene-1-carboxylate synthase
LITANDTHILLRAFADELARCGMTDACTSPGSRCSPLVLALAAEERLRCHSHIDERCSGFFALGMAKASGRAIAVVCTSGTAAANLLPAVIEAHEARVPLVILTADRPPELRQVGAGQAIDQLKLYGSAAKWFFEVGTHRATPERARWMRTLACRAYWTATQGRPGVVHLNWPLREPLVPDGPVPAPAPGRAGRRPWVLRRELPPDLDAGARALGTLLEGASRAVVVAGATSSGAAASFAERAGLPLLADPLSGARRGAAAIAHYDHLLGHEAFAEAHQADAVIRIGDLPTSKPLRQWLARQADSCQIMLDPDAAWQDPDGVLSDSVPLHPETLMSLDVGEIKKEDGWLDSWVKADARASEAIDATLDAETGLTEPWVARELGRRLPAEATLCVASSMPIRDVESFFEARDEGPRVLSNRGANGIDGTVSAAYGAAATGNGPTVLLIGDVALAHDIGGLMAARRLGLALTIVVLNNDGGGIFEFLPVARAREIFEEHVATPHGLDFAHACELYGIRHHRATDRTGFGEALASALKGAGGMIEISTQRKANLALHRRARAAVADALTR